MKIDLRKAYDVVNWEICGALTGYRFPKSSIPLVITCVSSPYFTIKVNGEGHGIFAGKRGLRQGDPMSPLLFVLVMEYLSRVLKCMGDVPNFNFHSMCKHLKLTHLIFADDLMILCRGDAGSVTRVMEALTHFSEVTGLVANVEKSNLFVPGIDDGTQGQLLEITGFTLGQLPIRYLGLPLSSKKWTRVDCQQLMMKITNQTNTRYSKLLSYDARIQVVTAVLFSIHSFWWSVFILPKSILMEVDKICKNYIWGSNEEKRKVLLVAWRKFVVQKSSEG
ncbi:hypothetical protein KY289_025082 [Solanum tuberosum]|uniref:Non-LTR retroelement reverse transcriptase n=1 Tax=Solanum tuberosum TaxID=4113 RepID=M1B3P7_SOLTU|nr:hypothetical protein KY284_034284 [Solanum tuberosum]KAH0670589.1 hypothetical protein KY289_025082 [Solanum tuberosum]